MDNSMQGTNYSIKFDPKVDDVSDKNDDMSLNMQP